MIQGRKGIAGYGSTRDANGREIVQEFQQCSHCQRTWVIQPGSGRTNGFCLYCNGIICSSCVKVQWKRVSNKCVPYSEGAQEMSKNYVLDPTVGIFLRKSL